MLQKKVGSWYQGMQSYPNLCILVRRLGYQEFTISLSLPFRQTYSQGLVQKSSNNKTQGDKIENLGSGKTWGRLRSWENYSAQAQDEREACLLE